MKTKMIPIGEAARLVGVHTATLARMDKRGDFKAKKDLHGWRYYKSTDIAKLKKLIVK